MRRLGKVVLLITVLILVLAVPAAATKPAEVSGKWGTSKYTVTPPLPCKQRGPGTIVINVPMEHDWGNGSFQGKSSSDWVIIGRETTCDTSVPGASPANLRATGTFVGDLYLGAMKYSGSFDFRLEWRITHVCPWGVEECENVDTFAGKLEILRGYGGLAGLHGVLEQWGRTGPTGRWGYVFYKGQVHIDPQP
ncbi:MAG: hypothetical protein JXA74_05140 [Anaerolineae bacterium]|nr:hypothetical protein [Anaerolineae bacterium]